MYKDIIMNIFEYKKVVIPTFKSSNRYESPAHKLNRLFVIEKMF